MSETEVIDDALRDWHTFILATRWRVGRKLGRTVYAQMRTGGPSDADQLIGMMDSPELAEAVVMAHNRSHGWG